MARLIGEGRDQRSRGRAPRAKRIVTDFSTSLTSRNGLFSAGSLRSSSPLVRAHARRLAGVDLVLHRPPPHQLPGHAEEISDLYEQCTWVGWYSTERLPCAPASLPPEKFEAALWITGNPNAA
ncbi:hypothetical protein JGS39_14720 [Streptomyces sp. P01-B04]|uniref:hypothetical protein n=1 Tax=Streptomyces poriferorum TaxID=2798799 RepID=UPI001C5D2B0B|nr:hypothetical protein [Streptomyces poriferorum]MBW5250232.1 hypothetical protein [Streptomyces poriferorum]MBW5259796.1 hypothetical protein [Streptomyces poriferorum]